MVGWLVGWLVEAKCVWVIRLLGGGLTLGPSRLLLTHEGRCIVFCTNLQSTRGEAGLPGKTQLFEWIALAGSQHFYSEH